MGIAHLLTGLSLVFTHHSRLQVHWIPTSWMILLLLVHFELFWHTLAILAVEEWRFAGFLYILTGPVLLYLAMSLMVPDPALVDPGDSLEQYFQMARQFFFLLAMLMVWMIGVDFVLNEFVAFVQLEAALSAGAALDERSLIIAIYALATFANFGSVAMTVAGLGEIAPERRHDLARLGVKAMFAGLLAALLTAAFAGILV